MSDISRLCGENWIKIAEITQTKTTRPSFRQGFREGRSRFIKKFLVKLTWELLFHQRWNKLDNVCLWPSEIIVILRNIIYSRFRWKIIIIFSDSSVGAHSRVFISFFGARIRAFSIEESWNLMQRNLMLHNIFTYREARLSRSFCVPHNYQFNPTQMMWFEGHSTY